MESVSYQAIETFGAGIIALFIVFGLIVWAIKELIPAIKALGNSIELLSKAMTAMQEAFVASIHSLENRVLVLENKLDNHVLIGAEIKQIVVGNTTVLTEVKERTRNCVGLRPDTLRTRKGE